MCAAAILSTLSIRKMMRGGTSASGVPRPQAFRCGNPVIRSGSRRVTMLRYRVTLGVLLAVVISWVPASPVGAGPQAFVSASGADVDSETYIQNNCAAAWPCRTIGRALDTVDAGGEVVIVSSGDYEPFAIERSVSV